MSIYYKICAPAKLNLNLFVRNKILDGLHFLETDICFLELVDKIYLKFSKNDTFHQNKKNSFTVDPKNNLILQAIKKFIKNIKICFFIVYPFSISVGLKFN